MVASLGAWPVLLGFCNLDDLLKSAQLDIGAGNRASTNFCPSSVSRKRKLLSQVVERICAETIVAGRLPKKTSSLFADTIPLNRIDYIYCNPSHLTQPHKSSFFDHGLLLQHYRKCFPFGNRLRMHLCGKKFRNRRFVVWDRKNSGP